MKREKRAEEIRTRNEKGKQTNVQYNVYKHACCVLDFDYNGIQRKNYDWMKNDIFV